MGDEVAIELTRLDSSENDALIGMARNGAASFGWQAELTLDRGLAQLLRLRVSQINNCTYCLNRHYQVARDFGVDQAKLDTLSAWWETALFTPAEEAALSYTEALTRISDTTAADRFQDNHLELAAHFSPAEILEVVGVVINMNIWTRLKLAEGAMPKLGG